jgi:hypothetical protein
MNQVNLQVYSNNTDETTNRRISRKLALLCYYLNTRFDSNYQFVHGGVYASQFTRGFVPSKDQARFELVVNSNYVINNAFYLNDDNYSDDDFRGFAQSFVQSLALNQQFSNFKNYQFRQYAPIVVGEYFTGRTYDGRTLPGQRYTSELSTGLSSNFSTYQNFNGSKYQIIKEVKLGGDASINPNSQRPTISFNASSNNVSINVNASPQKRFSTIL